MRLSKLKALYKSGAIDKPEYIKRAYADFHFALFDYIEITESTDVKEIRITPEGVSFVVGDEPIRLYAPPREARVAPLEIMNFDRYEPAEMRVMDLLSGNACSILDIGANIGFYSIRFAKIAPDARIYSFEPIPKSFLYLQRNIAINSVGERVVSFNYGLSNANNIAEYISAPMNGTNASLKNVAASADVERITGSTFTLDNWAANYRVAPDFIKCDVEGAELFVFQGGVSTITTCKPVVFSEILRKWSRPFGYHPNDVLSFFKGLGYSCFAVGDKGSRPITKVTDETVETNYAFLHCEAHADFIAVLAANK